MLCIILSIILLFVCWIVVYNLRRKYTQLKQRKEFQLLFKKHSIALPKLEFGSSYSWPTFVVTFANKSDYDYAEETQLFIQFKEKIQSFYDQNFSADAAIYFTYPEKTVTIIESKSFNP